MKNKPFIYKDSMVVCPQCATKNYRITRDCFIYDRLVCEMFESLNGIKQPVDGEILGCSECGVGFNDFHINPDFYLEKP